MRSYQKLSDSERLIMEIAWRMGEVSNPIILERLKGVRDWNRHTVKAYTKRLTEKGFLEEKKDKRKTILLLSINKKKRLSCW